MLVAVADTHAVIWYLHDDPRLSVAARLLLSQATDRGDQVGLSTITLAEIVYLGEKGRISLNVFERLLTALDVTDALLVELPFTRAVAVTMPQIDRAKVPDLPDRMIAATARLHEVPLISRDHKIQGSGVVTVW